MANRIRFISIVFCVYLVIGLVIVTDSEAKKYKSAKVSINGSCFTINMTAKKACEGDIKVGFYKNGKGYWLDDKYSMIKNGKETIKGCWNENRAEIGDGPSVKGTLNYQQGTLQIFIDGKKIKESTF